MKLPILGIVLGLIMGIPAATFASSFAASLAHGKTPTEAIATLSAQVNSLTSRLDIVEAKQAVSERNHEAVSTTSSSTAKTHPPAKPAIAPVDPSICVGLKVELASSVEQQQKLKAELATIMSASSSTTDSIEDIQKNIDRLKSESSTRKEKISTLDTQIKAFQAQIKAESCI